MQIDLFDTKKFIEINNLKEVTDPMLFLKGGVPSPNGLLSSEIFGISVNERMRTYAYIDLHGWYLHPFICKLLKRLNRNFDNIIHSSKKYRIENGDIVEDEENGDTGIDFLYNNWEKLNFTKNESLIRGERIDVLKSFKKNVLFTRYWIVIPAYYRDVNLQNIGKGKLSHNEINDKYSALIRTVSVSTGGNMLFDITLASTRAKVQDSLVDLYDFIKGKIEKKTGMIRKNLLGKSVDYGSRTVISAPIIDAETPEEMNINLYHTGLPLAQCCSLFNPFIVAWVKNFFRRTFETSGGKMPLKNKDGKITQVEVDSPEMYFNDEFIKKQIDAFIRGHESRFDIIYVPVKHEKKFLPFTFTYRDYIKDKPMSESNIKSRACTWCDIFYQAAVDATDDKMVSISRYPILDNFSFFNTSIFVISTKKTMPVYIDERVYENYPVIDIDVSRDRISSLFIDTTVMSNAYLKGLVGDYDGDQVSNRGLFTQEANAQAKEIMHSKKHFMDSTGKNFRTCSIEAIQTLYNLTKDPT